MLMLVAEILDCATGSENLECSIDALSLNLTRRDASGFLNPLPQDQLVDLAHGPIPAIWNAFVKIGRYSR